MKQPHMGEKLLTFFQKMEERQDYRARKKRMMAYKSLKTSAEALGVLGDTPLGLAAITAQAADFMRRKRRKKHEVHA